MLGFDGMDYASWVLFKLLILAFGEDYLIDKLEKIKNNGGVRELMTIKGMKGG